MKQMKAIITILTLLSTQSESLPVTSKALDNSSDQLIWQTSWYSQNLNEGGKKDDPTPFTGDSRKITAKSIFITPNFSQNTSHCPPGFKVDDNGKCIKVVNINQDDLLVTRLQGFFPQHETTDDTTNIDYDYSLEDEESREPTHFTLPLVPILSDNESNVNEAASTSTVQYEIELNEYSFRQPNGTDSSSTPPPNVVIDLLNQQQDELMNSTSIDLATKEQSEEESSLDEPDENSNAPHQNDEDEKNTNSSENDTTTAESLESLEQTEMESPEVTTTKYSDSRDISNFDEDDNHSTTSREFVVINKSESFDEGTEADKTISNRSDTTAIHLDDYFDTILLNDSLLIDETSSYENTTDIEYDVTTITAYSPSAATDSEESTNGSSEKPLESTTDVDRVITTSTGDFQLFPTTLTTTPASSHNIEEFKRRDNDFPYENRIIKDDQQDLNSANFETTNKFVYHHLPATDSSSNEDILATPTTVVRFPSEASRGQRVRFPDESQPKIPQASMSFAWPRENRVQQPTGGLMRFWQEQPLIYDFRIDSRGNSRAPSGSFNRPMSYRRNYR